MDDSQTYYFLWTCTRRGISILLPVHKARQLGLTGWVKNKYDGTVEAEVQGLEEQIDQLIQYLNSQTYILITNMDVKKLPVIGEHDFIRKGY